MIVFESNYCVISEYKGLVVEFSDFIFFLFYFIKYKMLCFFVYSSVYVWIYVGVMMILVCFVKLVLIWMNYIYFVFNLDLLCKFLLEL